MHGSTMLAMHDESKACDQHNYSPQGPPGHLPAPCGLWRGPLAPRPAPQTRPAAGCPSPGGRGAARTGLPAPHRCQRAPRQAALHVHTGGPTEAHLLRELAEEQPRSNACLPNLPTEQPEQGRERRTSSWTERRVWGSVRVRVLDTRVHSASGPKPPRAWQAFGGRHTRSSCRTPASFLCHDAVHATAKTMLQPR